MANAPSKSGLGRVGETRNQGKTLQDIPPGPRYISVTTRRGTNTEQDEEETSEEEEVGEPSQERPTPLPSPTTTSPPPKFKFWRQMCPEEQQARKESFKKLRQPDVNAEPPVPLDVSSSSLTPSVMDMD